MKPWPVLVITEAAFDALVHEVYVEAEQRSLNPQQVMLERITKAAHTYFARRQGATQSGFRWVCPGCGVDHVGVFGTEPVSGWEAPRWVDSGTADFPTLTPSLGCGRWHYGRCYGHWWLKHGVLEPA